VNTNGLMEGHIMEIGEIIKCMVKVYSHGQMAEDMKVNILKIKNKDMVHSSGLMEENTWDNGLMGNNMVKEHLWL